jgi:hypothetical protein
LKRRSHTVLDDLDAFPKVMFEQAASELYVTNPAQLLKSCDARFAIPAGRPLFI